MTMILCLVQNLLLNQIELIELNKSNIIYQTYVLKCLIIIIIIVIYFPRLYQLTLTIWTSSILVITPTAISCLSDTVSGHGYKDALNLKGTSQT